MKRTIISLCVIICLVSSVLCITVFADDEKPLVVDDADLLTDDEEAKLTERLKEICDYGDLDIVILTVHSIGDKEPVDFADDYFDENGYGRGKDHNGILLLNSPDDPGGRVVWISTCGLGLKYLNDDALYEMRDALISYLVNDNFYDAYLDFANRCESYISEYNKQQVKNYIIYGVIAVLIGLLFAAIKGAKYKKELISVVPKGNADDYIEPKGLKLTSKSDVFAFSNVTKTVISSSSGSSGRGGSSSHTSSSGRSHGGAGGRY